MLELLLLILLLVWFQDAMIYRVAIFSPIDRSRYCMGLNTFYAFPISASLASTWKKISFHLYLIYSLILFCEKRHHGTISARCLEKLSLGCIFYKSMYLCHRLFKSVSEREGSIMLPYFRQVTLKHHPNCPNLQVYFREPGKYASGIFLYWEILIGIVDINEPDLHALQVCAAVILCWCHIKPVMKVKDMMYFWRGLLSRLILARLWFSED